MAWIRLSVLIFMLGIVSQEIAAEAPYCREFYDRCIACTHNEICFCKRRSDSKNVTLPCIDGFIESVNYTARKFFCNGIMGKLRSNETQSCKERCYDDIEDVMNSKFCPRLQPNMTSLAVFGYTPPSTVACQSVGWEPWISWLLLALNILQAMILFLVGLKLFLKNEKMVIQKPQKPSEFEMLENDMYAVPAET